MAVSIVRLGSRRGADEGLRIGTVRRPPRGVRREEFGSRDFFDVWFPTLSPMEPLLKKFFPIRDEGSWRTFRRLFLAEMKRPDAAKALDLLAALSHHSNLSIGCYCEDETRCHRSILRDLLVQRKASLR